MKSTSRSLKENTRNSNSKRDKDTGRILVTKKLYARKPKVCIIDFLLFSHIRLMLSLLLCVIAQTFVVSSARGYVRER